MLRYRFGRSFAALAALAAATPAHCDTDIHSIVGRPVRIRSRSAPTRLEGTLVSVDAKTLTIDPKTGGAAQVVDRGNISRLVWRSRESRRGKAALTGLAIGAAAGFLLGFAMVNCSESAVYTDHCVFGGILVSIPGALLGAGGAALGAGERWDRVRLDPIRAQGWTRELGHHAELRVAPTSAREAGIAVSVSIR